MEMYNKLDFPQRAKVFETFLSDDSQLPKTNPPYLASIFPEMAKQIVCILGYHLDP